MQKAMALRVKYRKSHRVGLKNVYKIRVPIWSLTVHLKNRGGVYPNGETCKSILTQGFLREEADHAGVCVENVPKNLQNEQVEDILEWNKETTAGVEELCTCFDNREILYGKLSHSHLLLVLLC